MQGDIEIDGPIEACDVVGADLYCRQAYIIPSPA